MFGLFGKKKILTSRLLEGMTDIHCHLLPAVDDGAENEEEALQALRLMESVGVQRQPTAPTSCVNGSTVSGLRCRPPSK